MLLRAREFKFRFPRPVLVMGVLNVTPDSFSDGGDFLDPGRAAERAIEMVEQGAEIIDIGGESSRPGSRRVSEQEELRRVMPVLDRLGGCLKVPISIDTTKPAVARAALDAGASLVNDIAANRKDTGMWRVVAEAQAGYICMHMQGTPQTMQRRPAYADVVEEVAGFFAERICRLGDCGVRREQLILDPGIGFGKSLEHNLKLLGGCRRFKTLKRPLLIGASRKSFLGKLPGADQGSRLPGSLACACFAAVAGANIIRAHDVRETVQALRVTEAVLARTK
jgi:dihydropteroate synthase